MLRLFALLLLVAVVAGCKKNEEAKPATQEDFASAKATLDVIAEIENLNDMALDISQESNGDKALRKAAGRLATTKESVCGTYTYTGSEAGGLTLTIDFGTGQTCTDGITRSGKLIYTIPSSGNASSLQFEGYKVDGKQLSGDYNVSWTTGTNEVVYTFAFKNAVLTYADGSKAQWNSAYNMKVKFVPIFTFTLETSGSVSGTSKDGKAFSATIGTPLYTTTDCADGFTKGTYLIKVAGHPDATYDFGDGTCDNKATLTIRGTSETLTF